MFQGIEQNDDSFYSSKENDESDIEPGKFILIALLVFFNESI